MASPCSFRHGEALPNHADEIMKSFHISDASLLKKSLVYFKPKSDEKKKQEFLQQRKFESFLPCYSGTSYLLNITKVQGEAMQKTTFTRVKNVLNRLSYFKS